MVLEKINNPNDVKNLIPSELETLAQELREEIIMTTSKNGGHLASSLGTVELTIALLRALDLDKDKVVWDVGHQTYAYKLLTGRRDRFYTLRTLGGISGFPRIKESKYDFFGAGHSSTSISVGLGFCVERDYHKRNETVVSIIGDGSFTGGEAFEGINNAAKLKSNYIIILNDNDMSISKNEGGLHSSLNGVRTSFYYLQIKDVIKNSLLKIPIIGKGIVDIIIAIKKAAKQLSTPTGMIFENMGIVYIGPIDGHDVNKLVDIINQSKKLNQTVVIHIKTKKGYGYLPAEKDPVKFHGIGPFDIKTGNTISNSSNKSYTKVFSDKIVDIASKDDSIFALTAAMADGTGLNEFAQKYPNRFYDTGIAEQHTVTFAASLAKRGLKPIVCIYSTFLQRAYDQLVHDVCLQNLPVVFCIDRAGLVGADGETHQGILDISYLSSIPNMVIMAPKNANELEDMLEFAVSLNKPVAIRYPRGESYNGLSDYKQKIEYGISETIYNGKDIALLALGRTMSTAEHVYDKLKQKGFLPTLINARFANPIDEKMIDDICKTHNIIVTLEENVRRGGFGEAVSEYIHYKNYNVHFINESLPNVFVEHGDVDSLRKILKVDSDSVVENILKKVKKIDKALNRK